MKTILRKYSSGILRTMEEIPQDQEKNVEEESAERDLIQETTVDLSSFIAFEQQPTNSIHEELPLQLYQQQNVSIPSNYALVTCSDGSDMDREVCRICHNGSSEEMLLSPCLCRGSAKYAHQSCLMTWFETKKDNICELCLYDVKFVRKGFKYPNKWKLPVMSCDFVAYLFMFYCVILASFIGMVLWIASNGCTTTVCVVLYFVSIISLIYLTYCCGFIKQIVHFWTACLEVNTEVVILSRTEDSIAKTARSSITEPGVRS